MRFLDSGMFHYFHRDCFHMDHEMGGWLQNETKVIKTITGKTKTYARPCETLIVYTSPVNRVKMAYLILSLKSKDITLNRNTEISLVLKLYIAIQLKLILVLAIH